MNDQPHNLDHAMFREQIAAALAGGLSATEQAAFDAHALSCEACAGLLREAQEVELRLNETLEGIQPIPGLEDRIIHRLRLRGTKRQWKPSLQLHPLVKKSAAGVAAAIVLAGLGYAVNQIANPDAHRLKTASNLRQIGQPILLYSNDNRNAYPRSAAIPSSNAEQGYCGRPSNSPIINGNVTAGKQLSYSYQNPYPATQAIGSGFKLNNKIGAESATASDVNPGTDTYYAGARLVPQAKEQQKTSGDASKQSAAKDQANWFKPTELASNTPAADTSPMDRSKVAGQDQSAAVPFLQPAQQAPPSPASDAPQLNKVAADIKARRQIVTYNFDDALQRAQAAARKGDLSDAQNALAAARNARSSDPSLYTKEELHQFDTQIAGAQLALAQQENKAKQEPAADHRGATQLSIVNQQTKSQASRERTVSDLEQQARRLADEQHYGDALGVVNQILAIDPHNGYANGARANLTAQTQASQRKVIRNGTLEFEVDRFDSALMTITKLVNQVGGYVGTTDSQQLPNGKVRGTVTVRVPPDRLDTLVLELRGIGDLKSQKLEAQDVSKQYTDTESELRAAQAMQDRLLDLIKQGKGQIKDLLAAEKELGVWRTKIEQLTGQIKFWDNQVALATLNITLQERAISTPASAYQSEAINAGVEAEDVEKARADALKAIADSKGRIVQSELKRFDAGQLAASIIADVPADASGPLLDRIRQLGKVARLEIEQKQHAVDDGATDAATRPPVHVETRDTRLNLSIYNLANVAPRQTTTLNLAASNVEQAYRAILARVAQAGGRVVTSSLARNKPEQMSGSISFEVPTTQADAVLNDIRYPQERTEDSGLRTESKSAGGTTQHAISSTQNDSTTQSSAFSPQSSLVTTEVMKLTVTENPDTQNTTSAKAGFTVSLVSSAAVAPRETISLQLAASDVPSARQAILQAASDSAARVLQSNLDQGDSQSASASIDLDLPRASLPAIEKAVASAGQTIGRTITRSSDTENTLDSKLRVTISLAPADKLPPRETTTMQIESADVESASTDLQAEALSLGGRVVDSNLSKDRDGRSQAKVTIEVPLDKSSEAIAHARGLGTVRAIDSGKDLRIPAGRLTRARVEITFVNGEALVTPDRGLIASIRRGLATSVTGLMWSLQLIVIGLCFVIPWLLILWGGWRLLKRRAKPVA